MATPTDGIAIAMKPALSNTRDSSTPRTAKRAIPTTEATSPSRIVEAIQPRNPRVSCQRRRSKYIGGSVPKIEHSRGVRNRRKNLYHGHHQNSFEHSIICACRVIPISASRRSSSRASALRWHARERHAAITSRGPPAESHHLVPRGRGYSGLALNEGHHLAVPCAIRV